MLFRSPPFTALRLAGEPRIDVAHFTGERFGRPELTQRFGDRVRIDWEVDDGAGRCMVPTLGLQPLLENCFRHVVERRREPTHVVVRAGQYSDKLRIEIEDDGDLQAIPATRGVGLGNLERRLQSLHGSEASLTFQVRSGGGLIARVELPCVH